MTPGASVRLLEGATQLPDLPAVGLWVLGREGGVRGATETLGSLRGPCIFAFCSQCPLVGL